MTSITQKINSLNGGISQQPDELKIPGQVVTAKNVFPDVTHGLQKRPGSQLVSSLSNKAGLKAHYSMDAISGAPSGIAPDDGGNANSHSNVSVDTTNKKAGTGSYDFADGGVVGNDYDVAKYADLLVGVVPITNLEWIQKIHRDNAERGYSAETIVDTILRRMPDYINHICPQFSRTDINFQRVPTIDTSNPFICRNIPTPDESFVIIHFRKGSREKWGIDFQYLLGMIHDSFMSSPTSIVINGGKMGFAMELILTPIIHRMIEEKKKSS